MDKGQCRFRSFLLAANKFDHDLYVLEALIPTTTSTIYHTVHIHISISFISRYINILYSTANSIFTNNPGLLTLLLVG